MLTMPGRIGVTTDADEFRAWVQPHLVAMARLAARLTTSHDADDVVQEALVRAWRRRESYDSGRGTPQAWLLAIVADRARDTTYAAPTRTTMVSSSRTPTRAPVNGASGR
jgi:RNA polymerase sigma-70 factor (ECF subfamily)